ncbi:hypothetical protein [Xanthomonas oryzae]|uniref:hypothetical protein n=1 Tax=Xanthomonas oryzae TaxID=347 RepID=UPI003DA04E1F
MSERAVVRGQLAAERELATRGITLSRLAALAAGKAADPAAEDAAQNALGAALRCAYGDAAPEPGAQLVLVVAAGEAG